MSPAFWSADSSHATCRHANKDRRAVQVISVSAMTQLNKLRSSWQTLDYKSSPLQVTLAGRSHGKIRLRVISRASGDGGEDESFRSEDWERTRALHSMTDTLNLIFFNVTIDSVCSPLDS